MKTLVQTKSKQILVAASLIAFNIVTFTTAFLSSFESEAAPVSGKSGSINGVPTCHCPDDATSCYCNY